MIRPQDGCVIAMPVIAVSKRTRVQVRRLKGVLTVIKREDGVTRADCLYEFGWLPFGAEWDGTYGTVCP